MYKCKYCDREFVGCNQVGGHVLWCVKNPNKIMQLETKKKIGGDSVLRRHTEESKKKISEFRLKYLKEHPDRVPYLLNHSSKKSHPEERFETSLIENGITGWVAEFRNGIYSYDFAFPELKIDVEIDGGTHTTEKVIKIDERRDEWSKSNGWKVIRFTATEVKKDINDCINRLKVFITAPVD